MARIKSLILFLMFFVTTSFSQNSADDIVGYYYCEDPFSGVGSQMYMYKASNGTYEGKVVWVETESLKKFIGLVAMSGLKYNPKEKVWEDGRGIYPGRNLKYDVTMKFETNTRLKVRGYWGFSLLGKNVYWTKEANKR